MDLRTRQFLTVTNPDHKVVNVLRFPWLLE
jgi:hypothetical protein